MDVASPDSKVHGANMGPIWGRQDPGGTHVGPMNFALWVCIRYKVGPLTTTESRICSTVAADVLVTEQQVADSQMKTQNHWKRANGVSKHI